MLQIEASHLQEISRHGEESYPDEGCGILLGTFEGNTRIVESIVRCGNATGDSTRTHYAIDPREVIRAQRQGRDHGWEIVGFYHSHPDHVAQWSPTDLAEAHWIGCSYLIVAVENGKADEARSFVLKGSVEEDKKFIQETLIVDGLSIDHQP